jgi:tRNA threonylcarbamoyladenosine biosynthesis protein TsaB
MAPPDTHQPPLILALETSTEVFSCALFGAGQLLALQEFFLPRVHARLITAAPQQLCNNIGVPISALQAVAVSKGPGSYTGLRISTSMAKGLCSALGIPLISVGSLQALAMQALPFAQAAGARICPLIDARRMEAYCALFDAHGNELQPAHTQIFSPDSFSQELAAGPVYFVGNGAAKLRPLVAHQPQALFLPHIYGSARGMGAVAQAKYAAKEFEDLVRFEPFYLKDFAVGPQGPSAAGR